MSDMDLFTNQYLGRVDLVQNKIAQFHSLHLAPVIMHNVAAIKKKHCPRNAPIHYFSR